MSNSTDLDRPDVTPTLDVAFTPRSETPLSKPMQYAAALGMVAVAGLLCFLLQQVATVSNLALVFVLPVVVAATVFGWGPALVASAAGVLAFDFFFVPPIFSLRISSPSDIWGAALLLIIAAIVSAVADRARRQANQERVSAEQAQALQVLAHQILEGASERTAVTTAAETLGRIFDAPAVILTEQNGQWEPASEYRQPQLTPQDREAAAGAFASHLKTRGETYPYDQSSFDFWPAPVASGQPLVLGVDFGRANRERPADPERFMELVAAYLAIAGRPAHRTTDATV